MPDNLGMSVTFALRYVFGFHHKANAFDCHFQLSIIRILYQFPIICLASLANRLSELMDWARQGQHRYSNLSRRLLMKPQSNLFLLEDDIWTELPVFR